MFEWCSIAVMHTFPLDLSPAPWDAVGDWLGNTEPRWFRRGTGVRVVGIAPQRAEEALQALLDASDQPASLMVVFEGQRRVTVQDAVVEDTPAVGIAGSGT